MQVAVSILGQQFIPSKLFKNCSIEGNKSSIGTPAVHGTAKDISIKAKGSRHSSGLHFLQQSQGGSSPLQQFQVLICCIGVP
jgi:hypothetical protein